MNDHFISFILDESKWLTTSMAIALLSISILWYRYRNTNIHVRHRIMAAMNLFFGITIGTMAFGHLSAVSVKLVMGTLDGSIAIFYLIGIALAVPSWWLIFVSWNCFISSGDHNRLIIILNAWLSVTLLVMGVHNLPLAIPAFLNMSYHLHTRKGVGWAIITMSIVVNLGLFVGSIIFLASGQSFEQFKGIE